MPWALILGAASPAVGVLLYAWLHERPSLARAVDISVYVGVPLLVAWQVLPRAWDQGSPLPVVAVLLGLGAVTATERVLHRLAAHKFAARTDDAAIVATLLGIGLHALLEGTALAADTIVVAVIFFVEITATTPGYDALAANIAIHRILVGLVIWWLVRPRHGPVLAALAVATIPVATVIGYLAAADVVASARPGVVLYHSFVAGTLLHVVFHQGRRDHDHGSGQERRPGVGTG